MQVALVKASWQSYLLTPNETLKSNTKQSSKYMQLLRARLHELTQKSAKLEAKRSELSNNVQAY